MFNLVVLNIGESKKTLFWTSPVQIFLCLFSSLQKLPKIKNVQGSRKMARSLRGRGGGVKARPSRKKFYFFLLFCFYYFFYFRQLIKIWKYHVKFVGRYFHLVVKIFSNKLGYFIPKIVGRKNVVKIRFRLF